jgi:hypothetical protein
VTPFSWSPEQGLEPTPTEARKWLADELNGTHYQVSWLDSVIRWVQERLRGILDAANGAADSPFSLIVTFLVALVVVALLAWVLPKVRRESVIAAAGGAVLDDLSITADTYRKLAAQALAEGRYDDAILDGFRAIAKDMSDRTLFDDAPGRTAHEVSIGVGRAFPDHAASLAQSADAFDAVRYGHRRASADQANQVRQLDADLVRARPLLAGSPPQNLPQDLSV